MSSTYGECLKLSIFGQSHGAAIGMVLDSVPSGLPIDLDKLQAFLDRRAPGHHSYSTPRKEPDNPEFLSGIVNGHTCGAPIAAIISNTNTKSKDYSSLKDYPRPGHADYPAHIKYGGYQDTAGGGHFSGRLTAPLCIAGGLCKQWLENEGINIGAHIVSIGGIADDPENFDPLHPQFHKLNKDFPVLNTDAGEIMKSLIATVKSEGDSVGGIIECAITGLPVGLGEPMFGGMENRIAQIIYAIPAVKGLSFGAGFLVANMRGSENNDFYTIQDDKIRTISNHAGGILGGLTTGMPIIFQTAIKPTPSIAKQQQSICLSSNIPQPLCIEGRHDPCIVPRAVPVVEAAAAIAIYDALLASKYNHWRD